METELPQATARPTRRRRRLPAIRVPMALFAGVLTSIGIYSAAASPSRNNDMSDEPHRRLHPEHTPRSSALQWCLLAALSIAIFAHLILLALIIEYRQSPSVKAAQSVGQSIVAFSGAAALVGGVCLVAPPSNAACALAEPTIFASITAMGASLAGMAWRVERVVAPILMLGRGRSLVGEGDDEPAFSVIKRKHRDALTCLAVERPCKKQAPTQASRRLRSRSIRQKVTNTCLLRLVSLLFLPQFVLQIIIISIPSLRSQPSTDWGDTCTGPPGAWTIVLSTILTILPFASAWVTTAKLEGSITIPAGLCEARAIRNIIFYFTVFSVSVAPLLAFNDTDDNQSLYISIYLLFGAVVSVSYFVVWPKLTPIFKDSVEVVEDQITASITRRVVAAENESDIRYEQALECLDQGRIFEEMEMPNNSIKFYDEALDLWQSNKNEARRHFTGDYTSDEIQDILSPAEADLLATLLISKAQFYEDRTVLKAAKCYLKAIEVYEFAPATESLTERSTIYPCFHSLFRLLYEGALERDFLFERDLSIRFLQETERHKNFHHAAALAKNAQIKHRSGLPREALEELNKMKQIYSVKDSRAISNSCGLDVCLLAISRSAIWYEELSDEHNALQMCDFVIRMLDDVQSTDPKEMHAILLPVVAILKEKQPGRMKKLYEEHVVKLVHGSAPFVVRNMHLVLTLGDGAQIDGDVSWVLSNANKEVSQSADFLNITLGSSENTVAAEACLLLAKKGESGVWDVHDAFCTGWSHSLIIDKGLAFATVASRGMEENGHEISITAKAKNEAVLHSLNSLADEKGHDSSTGPAMKKLAVFDPESRKSRRHKMALQLKAKKTLPHHLLLSHETAAFVGLTHDSLAAVFTRALSEEPRRKWKGIYLFYMSDSLIENFAPWNAEQGIYNGDDKVHINGDLRQRKRTSQHELMTLLRDRTGELRFFEITRHCSFFGSWFGWRAPGGYIHTSPSIWGVDVKMCPSRSYKWELEHEPSHDYNAYRRGIENLLSNYSPFAVPLDIPIDE